MNLTKLAPWNWFKHEDQSQREQQQVPVMRKDASTNRELATNESIMALHHNLDQLFNDLLASFGMPRSMNRSVFHSGSDRRFTPYFQPALDVACNEACYEITMEVPGLSERELSIEVKGDVLTIHGEKNTSSENNDKHYYRVERTSGMFQRTLSLPEDADSDNIRAQLNHGILHIQIDRKKLEYSDVKKIAIS